jgi:hypothetical protein
MTLLCCEDMILPRMGLFMEGVRFDFLLATGARFSLGDSPIKYPVNVPDKKNSTLQEMIPSTIANLLTAESRF